MFRNTRMSNGARGIGLLLSVGCILAGWPCVVMATNYYVNASQPDDSLDGLSWTTAKRTLQAAMSLVAPEDAVLVTNGVYASVVVPALYGVSVPWLAGHDWTQNLSDVVMNDSDGDGLRTWEEFWSGTSPTNAADVLWCDVQYVGASETVLRWPAATNIAYSVECAEADLDLFRLIASNIFSSTSWGHTRTVFRASSRRSTASPFPCCPSRLQVGPGDKWLESLTKCIDSYKTRTGGHHDEDSIGDGAGGT